MKHSEPKVTIDLAEYNELLEIKKESQTQVDSNGLTKEELSELICAIKEATARENMYPINEFTNRTGILVVEYVSETNRENRFRIKKK